MNIQTSPILYAATRVRELLLQGEAWALKAGIASGQTDYQRFIVLTQARSGSNLLCDLLNSSGQAVVSGELFQPQRIIWNYKVPDEYLAPEMLARRQNSPVQFLEDDVFRPFPRGVRAVGFKLFYDHAREGPLWAHLAKSGSNMAGLKVIHLRRENFLKTYLSFRRAVESKVFINRMKLFEKGVGRASATENRTQPPKAITLEYQKCLQAFETSKRDQTERVKEFAGREVLDLTYEALTQDYETQIKRVQSFLGLKPEPLYTSMKKQNRRSLSESIANYWELKEKFADSQWAGFFTD